MIRRAIAFLEQQRLQIALTALMVFIIGGFQVHQALDRAQYDSQESVNLQYHPIAFVLGALAPAVFILAPFAYWMFGRIVRRTAARFKERADTIGAMDQRPEQRAPWQPSRRVLVVTACVLGLVLVGSVGGWFADTRCPENFDPIGMTLDQVRAAGCYVEVPPPYVTAFLNGDYVTAMRLIRPLADQGNAYAQYELGSMYVNGQGVPEDYAEAAKWFRLAADQGNAKAQFGLGLMYYNGRGVLQNYAEAMKWYRRAADQNFSAAQNNLGHMYLDGYSVPKDDVSAYMWLNLAAAGFGDVAAKSRDSLELLMTPSQIVEAQKLAREWKAKPASR